MLYKHAQWSGYACECSVCIDNGLYRNNSYASFMCSSLSVVRLRTRAEFCCLQGINTKHIAICILKSMTLIPAGRY